MKTRILLSLVLVGMLLLATNTVQAHASLVVSVPAANAVLRLAPDEVRLWFTEHLESQFSTAILLNSLGEKIETTPSEVDGIDTTQLFVVPPRSMSDGVYTLSWQVLSSDDGHPSKGSFSFTIGEIDKAGKAVAQPNDSIRAEDAGIRSFNLWTLALLVGSLGFWLFTWVPAVPKKQLLVERRMNMVITIGWLLVGLGSALMLVMQTATTNNLSIIDAISSPSLFSVIEKTRFGLLWMVRIALWIVIGLVLWWPSDAIWQIWISLIVGVGLLLTNSLFSHASSASDVSAAVISDWLHLICTAFWVGGLVQFVNVIGVIRAQSLMTASAVGGVVGYFSNYMRLCVVGLILTGMYAAWLQVGSVDALLTTVYGQVLVVKLLFFLPLVGVAAINLFLTQRRLNEGKQIWVGRLRELVGVEIILTFGILIAVGSMTSIAPARNAIGAQQANADSSVSTQPMPYNQLYQQDDLQVVFNVSPGWVGTNTFTLTLATQDGVWVPDAKLVRLRFESESDNVGRSELELVHTKDGIYSARGANMSLPGKWKVRINIQRPDAYDTVTDFYPTAVAVPNATDPEPPLSERIIAMSIAGLLGLIIGSYSLMRSSFRSLRADALLSLGLIAMGVVMLVSVLRLLG